MRVETNGHVPASVLQAGLETIPTTEEAVDAAVGFSGIVDPDVTLGEETLESASTIAHRYEDIQRVAALYLLTLKEKFQLTQTAVDFAKDSMKQMLALVQTDSASLLSIYQLHQLLLTPLPD